MTVYATRSLHAVSASTWIPMNIQGDSPFNVGFGVVKTGGGDITFTVQHTFDNVFDSTVTPVAIDHSLVSGKTATIDGNYAYPVRAVRLNVTAVSGSANANLTVIQTGV